MGELERRVVGYYKDATVMPQKLDASFGGGAQFAREVARGEIARGEL